MPTVVLSYEETKRITDEFLGLLEKHDISPSAKSIAQEELLAPLGLIEEFNQYKNNSKIDFQTLARAHGVYDFAKKVLWAQKLPEFENLLAHLKLICSNDSQVTLAQNGKNSGLPIDASRKLVELYVACLVIHCGENVILDHPVHSHGTNPDVMLDYNERRWAIAIKATSSRHGQTLYENIKKASEQIGNSDADAGLVFISLRDSLDYKEFHDHVYPNKNKAMDAVSTRIDDLIEEISRHRHKEEFSNILSGKTKAPVIFLGQALTKVNKGNGDFKPTPIRILRINNYDQKCDDDALQLIQCMQEIMQSNLEIFEHCKSLPETLKPA